MLSFLKEGQLKPLGGEPELPANQAAEGGGQGDYLTVAGHGKKLKQSTMLLIILFVVGTVGVLADDTQGRAFAGCRGPETR